MTDYEDSADFERLKQLVEELPEDRQAALLEWLEGKARAEERQARETLTVVEFAERLGKHPVTVRDWLRQGVIKGTKLGREWFIPRSELEKIINPKD